MIQHGNGKDILKSFILSKLSDLRMIIKPFSCFTQLSMKFQLLIIAKIVKNKVFFTALKQTELLMLYLSC